MVDDQLDDENFDKPLKKKTGGAPDVKDEFEDDEPDVADSDTGSPEDDEDDDTEVVIEDDDKAASPRREFQPHSQEKRLGKRRSRFKTRRDAQYVRQLETTVGNLQRTMDKVVGELDDVKQSNNRTTDATIDSQISEAQRYHDQAKQAHANAVKDGDGTAAAEALDLMMEARDALNILRQSKQAAPAPDKTRVTERSNGDVTIPKPKIDPAVMRKFDTWSAENDWFNPRLTDQYSRIAFHIDNAIKAEGYDPHTDEYWDELDERLRENKTLKAAGLFDDEYDDGEDNQRGRKMEEQPRRGARERDRDENGSERHRPTPQTNRSPQNGSGNGKRKIVVSKARADAMREMGLNPGSKEWNQMAKKHANWDKKQVSA